MKKNKFIPYQKCPVCEGNKKVWVNQFDPTNTAATVGWKICHICNGAGIILMYREPEHKEVKKYGLNFTYISAVNIAYPSQELKTGDILENEKNIRLIYNSDHDSYQLVTDNSSIFLTKKNLKSKWRKI